MSSYYSLLLVQTGDHCPHIIYRGNKTNCLLQENKTLFSCYNFSTSLFASYLLRGHIFTKMFRQKLNCFSFPFSDKNILTTIVMHGDPHKQIKTLFYTCQASSSALHVCLTVTYTVGLDNPVSSSISLLPLFRPPTGDLMFVPSLSI